MRNRTLVGLVMLVATAGVAAPLAAQRSCTGPNGCSISIGVNATVVGTRVASAARMLVRPNAATHTMELVTATNTGWILCIGRQAGAEARPVGRGGRGGIDVASFPEQGTRVLVATLTAS